MNKTSLLHLLDATCGAYNLNNRGIKHGTTNICAYYEPETGHKCAIGRLITDEEAKYLQSIDCGGTITRIMRTLKNDHVDDLANSIWVKLHKYPVNYLQAIQRLHDEIKHWDENGLTELGRQYASEIKQEILNGAYGQI